jgi:hypothetical protein
MRIPASESGANRNYDGGRTQRDYIPAQFGVGRSMESISRIFVVVVIGRSFKPSAIHLSQVGIKYAASTGLIFNRASCCDDVCQRSRWRSKKPYGRLGLSAANLWRHPPSVPKRHSDHIGRNLIVRICQLKFLPVGSPLAHHKRIALGRCRDKMCL